MKHGNHIHHAHEHIAATQPLLNWLAAHWVVLAAALVGLYLLRSFGLWFLTDTNTSKPLYPGYGTNNTVQLFCAVIIGAVMLGAGVFLTNATFGGPVHHFDAATHSIAKGIQR